jgi:putative protein-disulfide isomerase
VRILFLLLISFPCIVSSQNSAQMQKPKIIYVYDALCGWCYGFSPVIQKFAETNADKFQFEVVSGGMVTGQRVGPIGEIAPYIKKAYKEVEKGAGVKFGENFLKNILDDGKAIFSSLEPSIALSVFKSYFPDKAIEFAGVLQKAIYFDGIEPAKAESYLPYIKKYGIREDDFLKKMKDPAFIEMTKKEFATSSQLGVTGFPTVFLVQGNEYQVISRGFVNYATFDKTINQFLNFK